MNNLDALWPKIVEMAREIHATPELRFEEKRAASLQAELLRNAGFDVESPYGGFDTAFRARFGKGKPVLAYTSEYDALPDIGHACGHHLIAASSIGAAIVVARQIEEQGADGQVWIIGTPGEEMGGGKVLMLENGAFEDADAVLQAHPADCDATDPGMNGVIRYDVAFRGLEAHAAAAPEEGRNALDGVLLFFQGINAWRQHLPDSSRVHGIVTDGGAAPNIVPARRVLPRPNAF
ncbi:MAG: M20/M25/M40 family metallo-hydrolase, partial [Candidatus Sumerlaeota bacterium]